ncbi:MAG: glycosyl hydrolase family 98 [Bacteroidaceae bacterium]|nr:glycosyl hydrolase family 98 [Bacteroidaceae bacterium]
MKRGFIILLIAVSWWSIQQAFPQPNIVFGTSRDAEVVMLQAREIARNAEVKTVQTWNEGRDKKLSYYFEDAKEDMPFRVCVPRSWDGKTKLPLMMFLHGGWNNESSYLDQNDRQLVRMADKYGYLLVSPLGAHSSYGNRLVLPAEFGKEKETEEVLSKRNTPEMMHAQELSEQDVINVLEIVLNRYPVDRGCMFLCGHSMGGGGTWYLGGKYPDYWRALAPMSGPFVTREGYPWERLRQKPILITEGTLAGASLDASRQLRDWMRKEGFRLEYKEVYADHPDMFPLTLEDVFCFFDRQQEKPLVAAPLRRPISTHQPMWILHIDTWNHADPQKIIDMVPEDIRPYVVFNLSLSINHRADRWLQVEYGYETAKSWLRTCAENRVWAMIQPSSGAFCHFTDGDMTVFDEFFRDYPNFVGFNYCEQFWGFGDPYGVTFEQRLDHWADLMELNVRYGGYLTWSWCNAYYDADRNPIALMKRSPRLRKLLSEHPENFICCEKYTMNHGFHEIESMCLGAWLGGYAGQYGTRFDETGWRGNEPREKFPVSAGPAPVLEHLLLTGQTVVDGPETIPVQVCHEIKSTLTADGFTTRKWEFYPQFQNIYFDIFRKILDGTIRLLTRQEVLNRTKVALIHDVNIESGDRDAMRANYIAPETLYDGLYKMPGDGTWLSQHSWFKSTGRYAAIPVVYALNKDASHTIPVQVKVSDYTTRWSSEQEKVDEFNTLYPQEYTGDAYAGRADNCWIIYNPFKTGQSASACIPLKYNSCEQMEVRLPRYSTMLAKEYSDHISLYFNNYDNALSQARTDTIQITGIHGKATYNVTDRLKPLASSDVPAQVTVEQKGKNLTLYVTHNGPLDIEINCKGRAKQRLSAAKTGTTHEPAIPPTYEGPFQYEAENFDYKGIKANITNGVNKSVRDYTAQGYLDFGGYADAAIRKTIRAPRNGSNTITIRYKASDGARSIRLNINGNIQSVELPATKHNWWGTVTVQTELNKGDNRLEISAAAASENSLLIDNVIIN